MIDDQTETFLTVDLGRLQSMCRESVLAYHKFESLMDCYGKGYNLAREEFKRCIKMLLDLDEPLRLTCGAKAFITPSGQCIHEPTLQRRIVWDMDDEMIELKYKDGIFVGYVNRDGLRRS